MKIYKKNGPFNILITLDENYLFFLNVMLMSLLHYNPKRFFRIYLLQTSIKDGQLEENCFQFGWTMQERILHLSALFDRDIAFVRTVLGYTLDLAALPPFLLVLPKCDTDL